MAYQGAPRGFGLNGKSIYMNVAKPEIVECNFVIDSTNGNGLGLRSLKSNGYINNVFMHTTVAPGVNNGFTNPNPLAGFAVIQFNNNFNKYLGGFSGFVSSVQTSTKIDNSALVAGQAYVITVLGDASEAKWHAVGVPAGITPAVGVAFIALNDGGAGNVLTSRVQLPKQSGIQSVEIIGNANLSLNNSNISVNAGAQIVLQFLGPTAAGDTTPIPTAPLDGSVCGMSFWFDGSSVTVDGL